MATLTMLQAINQGLGQEMEQDDRVVILGEDVGVLGSVFRATDGLFEKFGGDRVMDTPLAESGIIGTAIGMAMYGLVPVPEIQFADFIYPAFDQIVSEAAKMRYRSGGEYTVPMTIRTPYGGGIRGGHYHSQSPEAYFAHTPGLKVVIPATPYDAKGLLLSSIRDPDPVLFLEPKALYRSLEVKQDVPEDSYTVPLGSARLAREGSHATVVAWGAMVPPAVSAAERLAADDGIEVEVVDVRSIVPLDEQTILDSVKKTGRCVVVYEAPRTGGFGGEIAAIVAEKALEYLEAPIYRVAGLDTPFPYTLEHMYMPDDGRICEAVRRAWKF